MAVDPRIELLNFQEEEIFTYPLVLLDFQFHCPWNLEENVLAELQIGSVATYWPVARSGRFKALVHLNALGQHDIALNVAETYHFFSVHYHPHEANHIIRFYYQKSKGSDGTFDAPHGVDNSETIALEKIKFNAMLMQSAMAELMRVHGFGRETFSLELDDKGQPITHLLETSFTNEEIRSSQYIDQDVFAKVAKDIDDLGFHTDDRHKHAIILGCSHFNPITKKTEAHLALGGGKIGQFGSCTLHTWASHVGELNKFFLDNTRVSPDLLDDSCYRQAYWANYATGIGAFFHEIGHSLGLGHSDEGIMARGFDHFNRIFTVYEPVSIVDNSHPTPAFTHSYSDGKLILDHNALNEVTSVGGAKWHRASALKLHTSEWISRGAVPTAAVKPSLNWRRDVFGPVGHGTFDGDQNEFGLENRGRNDIAAFLITSEDYCDRLEILTNSTLNDLLLADISMHGNQDLFVLMDGEYILKIDIYAVAWIDGFRLHTNFRTTRVFGGGKNMAAQTYMAPPGFHFYSLFGSHGNHHVGTLGAFAAPLPPNVHVSLPAPEASQSTPGLLSSINTFFSNVTASQSTFRQVGAGDCDGVQDAFSFKDMGALLISCDSFVTEFKHLSVPQYKQQFAQGYFCGKDEHVFAFGPGEYLTQVDVRSGAWIDAVRFLTNKRISPWYGGDGGVITSFICPPGSYINGFFGSHGDNFVGTLGATYTALPVTPPPAPASSLNTNSISTIQSRIGGVRISEEGSKLDVTTFQTTPDDDSNGKFFIFGRGEALVQIDVCRQDDIVVGISFHTQFRSSSWYGKWTEDIDFIVPPEKQCIEQVSLDGPSFEYTFGDLESNMGSIVSTLSLDEDKGNSNIEIKSHEGLAFVAFCKANNGDPLVHKVLEWKTITQHPHLLYISYELFRHYVGQDDLTAFTINPVDITGSEGYAKCLPLHVSA